jgi:hypothetical protein
VVGNTMRENYLKFNTNIHTVTNGFDQVEMETNIELDSKFTMTHIGLMNADRNPNILWDVLSEIINENIEFKEDFNLKLIGKIDASVKQSIVKNKLSNNVVLIDYVSHSEVINYQKKSQVLLLIVNNVPSAKGIITGKIFEYLMAKRPIIAIAPKTGDLDEILRSTNAGSVINFEDRNDLKRSILELYSQFKKGKLKVDSKNIEQYHRRELTKKVAEIINIITE